MDQHAQARTLLVGAASLAVRERFGGWSFKVEAHSTTVTDNPCDTMLWLAERLGGPPRHLVWRAEDTLVPSLIAAAETANDQIVAAKLLKQLRYVFSEKVIDVAAPFGGPRATSFARVAAANKLPWDELTAAGLAEAHRTGCHGRIRAHLTTRVMGLWRLWLAEQPDAEVEAVRTATADWLIERGEAA